MKSLLAAGAILIALAAPAFANDCPNQIKVVQDMLSTSTLDDAAKKKIADHIAQAQSQHDGGQHEEALATLKDATQLLGM